jgi:glycosyltransferase involved in cell wall biosynthesis
LKVLYLSLGWTIHDRRFVRAAATRHDVTVVTIAGQPESLPTGSAELDAGQVELIGLGGRSRPRSFCESDSDLLPALDRIVRALSPDVVHAGPLTSAGWLAAMVGRAPLVASSWGYDVLEEAPADPTARSRAQYAIAHAVAVHVDCATVRELARQNLGLDERKAVTFPFGLELDRFPLLGDALPVPPAFRQNAGVIALSVRAWESHYGIETTLKAFERAHRIQPRLGLMLAAGGSRELWIREFVEAAGLTHAVWIVGALTERELAPAYRTADLYLSCTPSDGTSISLLESLAMGLPCVVADNGANREWVVEGKTGILAAAGDAHAFGTGLAALAAWSPEQRATCRALSLQIVSQRADWRRHTDTLLGTYDAVSTGSTASAGKPVALLKTETATRDEFTDVRRNGG